MLRPATALFVLILACLLGFTPAAAHAQALDADQRAAVVAWLAQDEADRPSPDELGLPTALSAEQSQTVLDELWQLHREAINDEEVGELPPNMQQLSQQAVNGRINIQARVLTLGELQMPFAVIHRDTQGAQDGERPLFICMHGGGANREVDGPHAWPVNTREWNTQVQFAIQHYGPEGVYVVPRMADDRLGRWWHGHNHDAFERVIEQAVAHWGVDPNRVYLLGISEGGYGTDILAPFMPDRFAGANAMAAGVDLANPPQNLRNLAFRTDVGENDTTFDRVGLARLFHERLDVLQTEDQGGYTHAINVQAGRGHGIDYQPGIAWIAQQRRDAWPDRLVWLGKALHDRRRSRHYWLQIVGEVDADAVQIAAQVDRETNTIQISAAQQVIEGDGGNPTHAHEGEARSMPLTGVQLRVLLNDELIDLDRPVIIHVNGQKVFEGIAPRNAAVLLHTLGGYADPSMAAPAQFMIDL